MTNWHLSSPRRVASDDDDIVNPMCFLARADEVANVITAPFEFFPVDTSASSRLALLVSSYVTKNNESC